MIMRNSLVFIVAIALMGTQSYAAECSAIPEKSDSPLVHFCETDDLYSFDLSGDLLTFNKQDFETRLTSAIRLWWSRSALGTNNLSGAHVEVWLSVPETNPQAAQARAVIFSAIGNVSLSFDLHDQAWELFDQQAAILDNASYPDTYGWRPKQVMVSFENGTDLGKASLLLKRAGLTLKQEVSPGWYMTESRIFDETAATNRVVQYDRWTKFIKSAQTNMLFEWIGARGKTVQFNMSSNTLND